MPWLLHLEMLRNRKRMYIVDKEDVYCIVHEDDVYCGQVNYDQWLEGGS
jgi:hypothetical protein